MKKLLLFGAIVVSINVVGQEYFKIETKADLARKNYDGDDLYGMYRNSDNKSEVYYINESESHDFQIAYYDMMGERTLMSCTGVGSIIDGKLLVKGIDGDSCWGDEAFEIFFTADEGNYILVIGEQRIYKFH